MLLAMLGFAVSTGRVSVDIPALSTPKAIAEIARISGQPLTASPETQIDIVCIKATDVPLEELKAQIAKATGAEWVQRGSHQVLVRPAHLDRAQQREETEAKITDIRAAITALPPLPPFQDSDAISMVQQAQTHVDRMHPDLVTEDTVKARVALFEILDRGPAARMFHRILPLLDVRQLASIHSGQALAYSSKPTKMQIPLPARAIEMAMREFEQEQGMLRRAIRQGSPMVFSKANDGRYWTWEAEPQVAKIFLGVGIHAGTGMPSFRLKLADSQNNVQAMYRYTLKRPLSAAQRSQEWTGVFELSPTAIEWNRLYPRMAWASEVDHPTGKPIAEVVEPWLDRHSHPEEHEPLSFAAGEALQKFAGSQAKNLVACIPDQALVWYEATNPKIAAQAFASHAQSRWNGRFEIEGSWIRYRPVHLSDGRRNRINRHALGQFFQSVRAKQLLTIEDAARYAYAVQSPLLFASLDQTATGYTERITGSYAPGNLLDTFSKSPLRVIGSLSPNQRSALLAGGGIPLTNLSSESKEELRKFTYGEPKMPRGLLSRFVWARDQLSTAEIRGTLNHEATEALGNGIPANAVLQGQFEAKDMVLMTLAKRRFTQSFTPVTLGEYLADQEDELSAAQVEYQLGAAREFILNVNYTPQLQSHDELPELMGTPRRKYASWLDFPVAVKEAIERSMKATKDRMSRQQNQFQTSPPP